MLVKASKKALLAAGKGYVTTLGKSAQKEIQKGEPKTHDLLASKDYNRRESVTHHRRKSVVFKGELLLPNK